MKEGGELEAMSGPDPGQRRSGRWSRRGGRHSRPPAHRHHNGTGTGSCSQQAQRPPKKPVLNND